MTKSSSKETLNTVFSCIYYIFIYGINVALSINKAHLKQDHYFFQTSPIRDRAETENQMLKLSNYTITIPLFPPEEYLLYNTLSGTVVCIQDEQDKIIGRKTWNQENLSEDKETFQQLCELGFLVRSEVDESLVVKKTLLEWRYDTELLQIDILPTYWCNLNCSYCYQKGFDRSLTMSEEICKQMLGWVESKLEEFRSRKLNINFFGGEVLGKTSLMETICSKLKAITFIRGIELNLSLTTNGTLLTSYDVDDLKSWGINTVKITIDGDEATHNLRRPFLNGKGSFQGIIKNIIEQCNKLDIILRCNYDQDNLKDIPILLDQLAKRDLNRYLKYIELQPVLHRGDFTKANNNQHCSQSVFTNQQIEQLLWLTKEALDRGFQVNTELTGGRCPAFFKSSFLIDPIGDIYKCPAFLGNKQNSIGNVQFAALNSLNETFLSDESWSDCLDCPFLPVCCGGCRYAAQEKFGNFLNKKICEKEYFERVGLKVLELTHNHQVGQEEVAVC